MERFIALLVGVLAWAAVAGVALSVVNAWQDEDQILAFLPIAGAVIVAWDREARNASRTHPRIRHGLRAACSAWAPKDGGGHAESARRRSR